VPTNVNHFDLSLDESVPYVYIQSNAYSKKKIDPQNNEEEKTQDDDIVSIRKFKKSQTEKKSNKALDKSNVIAGQLGMSGQYLSTVQQ